MCSAFGPNAGDTADTAAADEDPITAMTRRSLRKLEQHEAEDQRRQSLSPLRTRGRSSTKSNTPSAPGGDGTTSNTSPNLNAPHASATHSALSVRSLSPGGATATTSTAPAPPFQVPNPRATSPPLAPFSPEGSRTGDWVAVSSRYTHAGDLRIPAAADKLDGSQTRPMHVHSAGGAENDELAAMNTNAQSIGQNRSRSPVLRTGDVSRETHTRSRASSLAPPMGASQPPFAISDESAARNAPPGDTAPRGHASDATDADHMHASHAQRPVSLRLPAPPNTTANTAHPSASGEEGSTLGGLPAAGNGSSAAENPLEKLRLRLEAWRSAPIPTSGRDDTPMSPPQFPPARTTSCGGSWSASEQLGRLPSGRGSIAGECFVNQCLTAI